MRGSVMGAVALAAAAVTIAARRRGDRLAAERFYDLGEPRMPVPEAASNVTNPSAFHRSDAFYAIYSSDLGALRSAVPTGDLRHVTFPGNRGLVMVIASRYHEWTCASADGGTIVFRPFGEVAVAALVTRRPAPPVVPVLPGLPEAIAAGLFWLEIAVTTREAAWAGQILGEPKFVADIDFDENLVRRGVQVSEDGRAIMAFSIPVGGAVRVRRGRTASYSVRHGLLLETAGRGFGYEQMQIRPKDVHLKFGDHAIGEALARLGIAENPILSSAFLASRWIAPDPDPLVVGRGRDAQHAALTRVLGRYTVRHPGTQAIDQYADPAKRAPRMGPVDFVTPWEKARE